MFRENYKGKIVTATNVVLNKTKQKNKKKKNKKKNED